MQISKIIKEKGFTQEEVAKALGITRVTLARNITNNPSVKTLSSIADVIGCKVGDFFADDVTPTERTYLIHDGELFAFATVEDLKAFVASL